MYSVGIDIQDIDVFRNKTPEKDKRFYARIFTPAEIAHCSSKANPAEHFAARFAAKEALIKAVGPKNMSFAKIEIVNREDGKPEIRLLKKTTLPENHEIELSLSHSKSQAVAVVLIHPSI